MTSTVVTRRQRQRQEQELEHTEPKAELTQGSPPPQQRQQQQQQQQPQGPKTSAIVINDSNGPLFLWPTPCRKRSRRPVDREATKKRGAVDSAAVRTLLASVEKLYGRAARQRPCVLARVAAHFFNSNSDGSAKVHSSSSTNTSSPSTPSRSQQLQQQKQQLHTLLQAWVQVETVALQGSGEEQPEKENSTTTQKIVRFDATDSSSSLPPVDRTPDTADTDRYATCAAMAQTWQEFCQLSQDSDGTGGGGVQQHPTPQQRAILQPFVHFLNAVLRNDSHPFWPLLAAAVAQYHPISSLRNICHRYLSECQRPVSQMQLRHRLATFSACGVRYQLRRLLDAAPQLITTANDNYLSVVETAFSNCGSLVELYPQSAESSTLDDEEEGEDEPEPEPLDTSNLSAIVSMALAHIHDLPHPLPTQFLSSPAAQRGFSAGRKGAVPPAPTEMDGLLHELNVLHRYRAAVQSARFLHTLLGLESVQAECNKQGGWGRCAEYATILSRVMDCHGNCTHANGDTDDRFFHPQQAHLTALADGRQVLWKRCATLLQQLEPRWIESTTALRNFCVKFRLHMSLKCRTYQRFPFLYTLAVEQRDDYAIPIIRAAVDDDEEEEDDES